MKVESMDFSCVHFYPFLTIQKRDNWVRNWYKKCLIKISNFSKFAMYITDSVR